MAARTSAPVRHEPGGLGAPGVRHSYPAPTLLPASKTLRTGAAVVIAVVLGIVILLAFRPWEPSGDSGSDTFNPYGQGSAVHGGQLR